MNRLSLNQATVTGTSVPDVVELCVASGIGGIGLWREPVADHGLERTARLVREAGLTVTSLCRGGFFTSDSWLDDNRRAIEEAATLGTPVLVLVCGGLGTSATVGGARQRVVDALGELAPFAGEHDVQLAVEPLHPMFCSDRCVVSTLDQAVAVARQFPAEQVGVCVDTYHIWWDPEVERAIADAGDRIAAFQVCDWITPLPEGVLLGRGMMGDGCIELRRLRALVDATGYAGPIEVEIFNQSIWDAPAADVVDRVVRAYREHVADLEP